MDEVDDDLLTLDDADLVDITDEALDTNAGEAINLVPTLKSDGVLPDVYTINADGKLVSVSTINDFDKHHKGSSGEEKKEGTYLIGEKGEVIHVQTMEEFEKHHKQGMAHFNALAYKRGSTHVSEAMPGPSNIIIHDVTGVSNVPVTVPGTGSLHIFSCPPVKKPPRKVLPKPSVLPKPDYADKAIHSLMSKSDEEHRKVSVQALPVPSPITYINGVPGQIVSGRQLQELQAILGYKPEIVQNASEISAEASAIPRSRPAVVLPATVTPILQRPLRNVPILASNNSRNASKKSTVTQQDISQTIIAKDSATYQREKNYYFSQTSVLSPLIPPLLTKSSSDEASREAEHLNKNVPLMTTVAEEWNMQGCVTFGSDTEGQVFAPRLLVPKDKNVGGYAEVSDSAKKLSPDGSQVEELLTYQGLYNVSGIDLQGDFFFERVSPPSDTIGAEHVYTSFGEVTGIYQGVGRMEGRLEKDIIQEEVRDDLSDVDVELDTSENQSENVKLSTSEEADNSKKSLDNVEVWTIKKEEDDFLVATMEVTAQNQKKDSGTTASVTPTEVYDPFEKYSAYACYLCLFSSTNREQVLQHWLDCHKINKPYICPYCDQEFSVSCNVYNHIVLQHGLESKKSVRLSWSPIFKQDIRINLGEDGRAKQIEIIEVPRDNASLMEDEFLFSCLGCNYASTHVSGVRKHLQTVHYKILPYMCPYCGCKFVSCFEAKRHVCVYHPKWTIKVFTSKSSYNSVSNNVLNDRFSASHLSTVKLSPDHDLLVTYLWDASDDPNVPRFFCKSCDFIADQRETIYKHVTTHHQSSFQGIACPNCKFYNKLKSNNYQRGWLTCNKCLCFLNLNVNNIKYQAGEPMQGVPIQLCLECGYICEQRSKLVLHVRAVHLKFRPYVCAYCSYSHMLRTKVRFHILNKHKLQRIHILKNVDLSNRANSALRGMCKQVQVPDSVFDELMERLKQRDEEGDSNGLPEPALIQRSEVVSVADFCSQQTENKRKGKNAEKDLVRGRACKYRCKLCEHICRDKSAMHRHVKSYHLNGKPHNCTACTYGAPFKYQVQKHMRMCHPNSVAYVNTNYKMLKLLEDACVQYYVELGKSKDDDEADAAADMDLEVDDMLQPMEVGSCTLPKNENSMGDEDEEEEDDLEEMMVQEDEIDSDEELEFQGNNKEQKIHLPVGNQKKKVFYHNPEFLLDEKLVAEPVVILTDVLIDILKTEQEW